MNDTMRCSFCSKSDSEVRKMIAGPGVYICDECVDICQEIVNEDVQTGLSKPVHPSPSYSGYVCSLCRIVNPAEQVTIIRQKKEVVCQACIDAILETIGFKKIKK